MYLGEIPAPEPLEKEVLVKVEASALNRADILQRKGLYPPPVGASEVLGMEIAGEVVETGPGAEQLKGVRVMALLSGGGYAQYVAVHKSLVMRIPDGLTMVEAAGIMEAFLTGWQALNWLAKLQPLETVLIHAGASGVGSACIQLAKLLDTHVVVTASGPKLDFCRELGADLCINYHQQNFDDVIQEQFPSGVNVIVDFIGAGYFQQNLTSLARDGRMVMLGFLGGVKLSELNLSPFLFKRLTVTGSTLRSRSLEYRAALVEDFSKQCYQHLESGKLRPVIDKVIPWEDVHLAHEYMESNKNRGKVVLQVGSA